MKKNHEKPISLSFSEQQFIEFLYGADRAKVLMKEQDEQAFDYYRKVYRNWQNGKKHTWNWRAFIFSDLWMLYRGLFLGIILQFIIFFLIKTLLPKDMLLTLLETAKNKMPDSMLITSFMLQLLLHISFKTLLGLFGNTFLKYRLEYQLQKRAFETIPVAQFDNLALLFVLAEILASLAPVAEALIHAYVPSYIIDFCKKEYAEIIIGILLSLHLYYFHLKPRLQRKK